MGDVRQVAKKPKKWKKEPPKKVHFFYSMYMDAH